MAWAAAALGFGPWLDGRRRRGWEWRRQRRQRRVDQRDQRRQRRPVRRRALHRIGWRERRVWQGPLSYKNNVAVTPGSTVTVTIPTGVGSNGADADHVGRQPLYPSTNTADM